MQTNWDIKSIYNGVESDAFTNDIASLADKTQQLNSWINSVYGKLSDKELLESYISKKNELMALDKLSLYVNLALSTDSTNEALLKANDRLDKLNAEAAYAEAKFIEILKNITDLDKLISESELLKEHRFFLKEQLSKAQHTLSSEQEALIAKLRQNGSALFEKQWEQLTSTLEVEYKGKAEPLTVIRNMAYSASAQERKDAYNAELKAYEKIALPAAFCMNGIKGEVITTAKLHNYSSPLEMTLADSRLSKSALDAMFKAIDKALPKLQDYFIRKAKKLGYSDALPFYDLFAPVTKDEKEYTLEEAIEFVKKCFYGFSKDLGDFASYAIEHNWIDYMPKSGKVGGAFCETIHSIKESRILTNFGGTFNDVLTIAHELGHAFHNTRLFHLSELNSFYPMPIAETASNLCETIVINEALKTAGNTEKLSILENDLQGATQCIVDIYSRFLFEDSVFAERANGTLSSNELCSLMLEAQRKAYGKGLDKDYLHKYMWICKPHYYDAAFNYYNFPYAFGLLLARGLYSMYKKDSSSFVKLYDKLLAATSTAELEAVAAIADIDICSEQFWLSGLNEICDEIKNY